MNPPKSFLPPSKPRRGVTQYKPYVRIQLFVIKTRVLFGTHEFFVSVSTCPPRARRARTDKEIKILYLRTGRVVVVIGRGVAVAAKTRFAIRRVKRMKIVGKHDEFIKHDNGIPSIPPETCGNFAKKIQNC